MPDRQTQAGRGEWELWRVDDEGAITFHLKIDGQRFARTINHRNEADLADLRIAGMFWRHGERAAEMGYEKAIVTERCMAVERLFPEASELLPA